MKYFVLVMLLSAGPVLLNYEDLKPNDKTLMELGVRIKTGSSLDSTVCREENGIVICYSEPSKELLK